MGGDGMFSEILHGLVARTQIDHNVDQNQPDAELVPCSLRIGVIPAGGLWQSYQINTFLGFGDNFVRCSLVIGVLIILNCCANVFKSKRER